MMSVIAKYRDDISGAIVTSGSSTAYTVASNSVFDTLAHLNGQIIAFAPNATSTNAVGVDITLNVDSLGAKPIRMQPSVALPGGTLVSGTPYVVVYNNADSVFYLHNMTNPYVIPLAAGMDFWGSTTPNSSFAFPAGQAISRTTYATLFAIMSTTYGAGDGSTTFNLPDKRGRLTASVDNMGGSSANRLAAGSMAAVRHSLGGAGGADTETLTVAQLPTGITSVNGSQAISVTSTNSSIVISPYASPSFQNGPTPCSTIATGGSIVSTGNNSISVTSNNTSGSAHDNLQPTILCNYILRII